MTKKCKYCNEKKIHLLYFQKTRNGHRKIYNLCKKCKQIISNNGHRFKKGNIPWDIGLTSKTDPRIKHTDKIEKKCLNCYKSFYILPSKTKKFCCIKCASSGKYNGMYGKKHSKKTRKKQSAKKKNKTWEEICGVKKAKERKRKVSIRMKGCENPAKSINAREKISKSKMGDKNPAKRPDVKKKIRIGVIKYIKLFRNNCSVSIGKNEKKILDKLEKEIGYKIERHPKSVTNKTGYIVDGYIPELNLVIEIDEKYHKYQLKKDLIRQKRIEKELNCKFIRIKDE